MLASDVAAAAEKPEYLAALIEEGLEESQVADLARIVVEARSLITSTKGKKSATRASTLDEDGCRHELVVLMGKIRALAKRKYGRGNPRRADYYVGKSIDKSRAQLV